MIIIKLKGGLGNQLFCYAFGLAISERKNDKVFFDISDFNFGRDSKEYDLKNIGLEINIKHYSLLKNSWNRLWKKIDRKFKLNRFFQESIYGFDAKSFSCDRCFYYDGYWHSPKYFYNQKNKLNENLNHGNKLIENSVYLNEIKSNTTLCVHIRRGDYITNKEAAARLYVQTKEYYDEAISFVKAKKDVKIFYFTDDPEWVKNELLDIHFGVVVEGNKGYVDFLLMRCCDDFVISNSTFSWWPAWLSENPDKIMIAPRLWFKDRSDMPLLDSSWRLV